MKKHILLAFILFYLDSYGQSAAILIQQGIQSNRLNFESSEGILTARTISFCPGLGLKLRHGSALSSTWTLSRNEAFDHQLVGETFNYTFHFNELDGLLHAKLFGGLSLHGGGKISMLSEARQSVDNFSIDLTQGALARTGYGVQVGLGWDSGKALPVSLQTRLTYQQGLTNFEHDAAQSLKFSGILASVTLIYTPVITKTEKNVP